MNTKKSFLTKNILNAIFLFFILGCASTKPPRLLVDIKPEYPKEALEQGLEGKVLLYLFLSEAGEVKSVRVSKSSGYKILDSAAVEYGKKLRFSPAMRHGKPLSVILTWEVEYDALTAFFQPKEYVAKIQDYYNLAKQAKGEKLNDILEKILLEHEEYVDFSRKHPLRNYNEFLKKFILPEVYEQWKIFWDDWPLRFVVYHDFIIRFPSSGKTSIAKEKLIELLKEDIERIKFTAKSVSTIDEKKDLFLKNIYQFLNDHFPEAIDEKLRPEAEKYLKIKLKR